VISKAVEIYGRQLHESRAAIMMKTECGLTDLYKSLNDPDEGDPQIVGLRELHVELDYAVRDAYGWNETLPDLKHGFHEVRMQGERFTFASDVADEVLDLLLEENKRRYEAEVASGTATVRRRAKSGLADTLFELDDLAEESDEDDDEEEDDEEQE
jgi:hypothetical protein